MNNLLTNLVFLVNVKNSNNLILRSSNQATINHVNAKRSDWAIVIDDSQARNSFGRLYFIEMDNKPSFLKTEKCQPTHILIVLSSDPVIH